MPTRLSRLDQHVQVGVSAIGASSDDECKMFNMKNKEFALTVDGDKIECGFVGALYLMALEQDGRLKKP